MPTDLQVCTYAVEHNPRNLHMVPGHIQTAEMCLNAIKKDASCLKFVHNQTEEICMEALKKSPDYIKYIKNPTVEMMNFAKSHMHLSHNITYIPEPSPLEDCTICLTTGTEWCKLKCGHIYHIDCIKQCFILNFVKKCPYCQVIV